MSSNTKGCFQYHPEEKNKTEHYFIPLNLIFIHEESLYRGQFELSISLLGSNMNSGEWL